MAKTLGDREKANQPQDAFINSRRETYILAAMWREIGKALIFYEPEEFAGGSAGRRHSGVRRVANYSGTYETVGRIEKPDDELGFRFSFAPFVFRN